MMAMWESSARSHVGKLREINEDSVFEDPDVGLWAVADGMGGHAHGDVASQTIAESLGQVSDPGNLAALVDRVDDVLIRVNEQLVDWATVLEPGQTMGSTVVAMVANDSAGVVLWAGDSRLYRLRHGVLELVTRDHNPIGDMLEDGITDEQTLINARTNVVTRAIGGRSNVTLDFALFDVTERDTYLLCSDGLYQEVSESELAQLLAGPDVDRVADRLIKASLAGDARDNISVVVLRRCKA